MREIKFRAWDKQLKKMFAVESIDFQSGTVIGAGGIYPRDSLELMQFTGLQDTNGKEIYEGDIISDKGGLWKVIFYKAGYWVKFIGGKEGIVPLDWRTETGKIIGNIYENPELLKGA